MSMYRAVKRGNGPRAGQLLQHVDDSKRWQVKVFLLRDAKNRKKYYSEVVHGGKKDAEARLLELLHAKSAQGQGLKPRSDTTVAMAAELWLKAKKIEVSPRTWTQYRDALARYVLPTLGHRKVASVTRRDIQFLYGAMRIGDLPTPSGDLGLSGRPLSKRTVRLAHAALRQIFNMSISDGITRQNPTKDIAFGERRRKLSDQDVIKASERPRFLAACAESFYGVLYRLMLDTGLRPGEAFALRWSDIDFVGTTVFVNKAVTRDADGEVVEGPPKTTTSTRKIRLVEGLVLALRQHKEDQRQYDLADIEFVFTNTLGKPLRPWTFSNGDLAKTLARAGINKSITLYGLRHSFASLHVESNTPIKVVSYLMGHSNIEQTADTYMHLYDDVAGDWMARFGAHLDKEELNAQDGTDDRWTSAEDTH